MAMEIIVIITMEIIMVTTIIIIAIMCVIQNMVQEQEIMDQNITL